MATFSDIEDFIRKFKEKRAVVIVTGIMDPDLVSRAIAAGACDYIDKAWLSNRMEFESRIIAATLLHNAMALKQDNVEIKRDLVRLRAIMEAMRLQIGATKEKDIEQAKKHMRDITLKERDAYWKKRIFALINIGFWGVVYGVKFCIEAIRGKH